MMRIRILLLVLAFVFCFSAFRICFFHLTLVADVEQKSRNASSSQKAGFFSSRPGVFFKASTVVENNEKKQIAKVLRNKPIDLAGSNPRYFICAAPKTGCTAWKNFNLWVTHGILLDFNTTHGNPDIVHNTYGHLDQQTSKMSATLDNELVDLWEDLDHILVARNPYIRFLSSYQDWLARNRKIKKKKMKSEVSFSHFTELYEKRNFRGFSTLLGHIDPVSEFCGFEELGDYIVLRVEEEALWFNQFLERYNLTKKMEDYTKGGNIVFDSMLNASSLVVDLVASIVGIEAYPSRIYDSTHHRDSANKVKEYYTPEIAKKVTNLFMSDFIHFQYPLWDGDPATFHYV